MTDADRVVVLPDDIDFGSGAARTRRIECLREILRLRGDEARCRTVVHFVYYRLVARRIVPKDAECQVKPGNRSVKLSSQVVSEALTWLRERGLVHDSEIVDESRSTTTNTGWPSIRDGLVGYVRVVATLDPWDGDPPVLVVESTSLKSFFAALAQEYRIDVVTLGGQASRGYLANDAADHLNKDTTALLVVDYDKPGGDIDRSAENRLRVLVPHWEGEWRRVAVTDKQFEKFGTRQGLMITKPDHRFSPPRYFDTLESEAVEQGELEASVRGALDRMLDERGLPSLADVLAEEQRQREEALAVLRRWMT